MPTWRSKLLYNENNKYAAMTVASVNKNGCYSFKPGPDCPNKKRHNYLSGRSAEDSLTVIVSDAAEEGVTVVDVFKCLYDHLHDGYNITHIHNLTLLGENLKGVSITNDGQYLAGVLEDADGKDYLAVWHLVGDNHKIVLSKVVYGFIEPRSGRRVTSYQIELMTRKSEDLLMAKVIPCNSTTSSSLFHQHLSVRLNNGVYRDGTLFEEVLSDMWGRGFTHEQIQKELTRMGFVYDKTVVNHMFKEWDNRMEADIGHNVSSKSDTLF
jgi:hypothetical protein